MLSALERAEPIAVAMMVVVSIAGLLASAFTLGYASIGEKQPSSAMALRLWVMGAAPPIVFASYGFAAGVFERGTTLRPEDSSLLGLSFVSLLFAPLWFSASVATAGPFRNGVLVDVLRLSILLGWLAAAGLTTVVASSI